MMTAVLEKWNDNKQKYIETRKMVQCLEKAAKLSHVESNYKLGETYYYGELNIEIDYYRAVGYYSKAAEHEHNDSLIRLSNMYFDGRGVEKDYNKIFALLSTAANGNKSMKAVNNLGWCYKNGYGVSQDYKKAFALFLQSVSEIDASYRHLGDLFLRVFTVE